jgi:3-dehydroquinate synthase
MNTVVRVETPGGGYDVVIGSGCLSELGERLASLFDTRRAGLVTDDVVAKLHAMNAATSLARSGFDVVDLQVPAGESSKSWSRAGELVEALAALRLGRSDPLVAVGGGVVGDLVGFAAAVYLRGVPFVQVPTTLLAMVDSSVGGKTGVDLAAGKNLAGAFKQPVLVLVDVDTLSTLPLIEWRSGLAEVAKTAVLDGEGFVNWLEERTNALSTGPTDEIATLVSRCVAFKAGVVSADEREAGPRECLNYGHTLAHAIEKVAGYGVFSHGAAVAEGMRFAARVAMDVIGADARFVKRQDRLLDGLGLSPLAADLAPEALLEAMHADKKVRSGVVRMVLADAPGAWRCLPVEDVVIRAHLMQWVATKRKESQ